MKTLLMFALILLSFHSQAQNLISNGGFDTDLAGWSAGGGVSWSNVDRGGASSGSILLGDTGDVGTYSYQCITSEPDMKVSLRADFLVPEVVTTMLSLPVGIQLLWYSSANCTSSSLASNSAQKLFDGQHAWRSLVLTSTPPPGADSVLARLYVVGTGSSDFKAHFDNIYLGNTLFEDGFEDP